MGSKETLIAYIEQKSGMNIPEWLREAIMECPTDTNQSETPTSSDHTADVSKKIDLIDRQAAIDALGEKPLAWTEGEYELGLQNQWQSDVDALKTLPSVQPHQIVRCKDCKWGAQDEDGWWYCVEIGGRMGDGEKGDGFCSDAERRTDGKNT